MCSIVHSDARGQRSLFLLTHVSFLPQVYPRNLNHVNTLTEDNGHTRSKGERKRSAHTESERKQKTDIQTEQREFVYTHVCFIYIHLCMYMYAYIHTYIHTYAHTHRYIHKYTHTYIHTHTHMLLLPSPQKSLRCVPAAHGRHLYQMHAGLEHPLTLPAHTDLQQSAAFVMTGMKTRKKTLTRKTPLTEQRAIPENRI